MGLVPLTIIFNLFFAIAPRTAAPPVIKNVPVDIFMHDDWAPANYVGQGRYLESLFKSVTVISHEGQLKPGPIFFEGTSRIFLEHRALEPIRMKTSGLQEIRREARSLFAEGSDTECFTDFRDKVVETKRCEISVLVHGKSLVNGPLTLIQIHVESAASPNITLVDTRLLPRNSFLSEELAN